MSSQPGGRTSRPDLIRFCCFAWGLGIMTSCERLILSLIAYDYFITVYCIILLQLLEKWTVALYAASVTFTFCCNDCSIYLCDDVWVTFIWCTEFFTFFCLTITMSWSPIYGPPLCAFLSAYCFIFFLACSSLVVTSWPGVVWVMIDILDIIVARDDNSCGDFPVDVCGVSL